MKKKSLSFFFHNMNCIKNEEKFWEPKPDHTYYGIPPSDLDIYTAVHFFGKGLNLIWYDFKLNDNTEMNDECLGSMLDMWLEHDANSEQPMFTNIFSDKDDEDMYFFFNKSIEYAKHIR